MKCTCTLARLLAQAALGWQPSAECLLQSKSLPANQSPRTGPADSGSWGGHCPALSCLGAVVAPVLVRLGVLTQDEQQYLRVMRGMRITKVGRAGALLAC